MGQRPPYPSDLPDEAWELIRPVITAWKARHPSVSGHGGAYDMREIVNAILYQARTGCQWRYLPHDLPPKSAVYYYFGKWRDDGTAETVHDLLHWQGRESSRRHEDPTAVILDSQTVRASVNAPKETTGLDPGKKSPGRMISSGSRVSFRGLPVRAMGPTPRSKGGLPTKWAAPGDETRAGSADALLAKGVDQERLDADLDIHARASELLALLDGLSTRVVLGSATPPGRRPGACPRGGGPADPAHVGRRPGRPAGRPRGCDDPGFGRSRVPVILADHRITWPPCRS
ncbi:transposase [Streptomyces sp. NPDC054797]